MNSIIAKCRTCYYVLKYQYLLKKAVFGRGMLISCKLKIKGPGKVFIGDNCLFEANPWGEEYVTIYTHQKRARVEIGNNVILRATRFGSHLQITVKDGAVLENASVFDSDFHNIDATRRDLDFNNWDRPVYIGARSYVGCECLCSKGTNLEEGVVVLPVSMIGTKTVAAGKLIGGYPAKVIQSL